LFEAPFLTCGNLSPDVDPTTPETTFAVADRGRLPSDVVDPYNRAHRALLPSSLTSRCTAANGALDRSD
jgi:hypothetical protein